MAVNVQNLNNQGFFLTKFEMTGEKYLLGNKTAWKLLK